ncbi:MAG: GNAT family N-acetyltransferase [Elusimicrobiota bacterium]|nr:GNAT family N-acetyltransferase [Elusimicrobiota bacterium]
MGEIRKASEVDEGALRLFYADAFPDRAAFLGAHWRWLYRVGRFPGVEPLVLLDGERVIGHAGAVPVVLDRLGARQTAIWFVDFAILPEFQGRRLGAELTRAWMALCPDRVTFCNDRSIRVFRKFGWRERFDADVRSLPIIGAARPAYRLLLAGAPRLSVGPLPASPAELTTVLEDSSPAPVRVLRDEDWARWRLYENPRSAEYRLAEHEGVKAVVRLFDSLGRRRAHLLHVGPGTAAARAALVAGFARWAVEQGAGRAWMATNDQALLAAASWRLPRGYGLRFAWHSDDAAVGQALFEGLSTQALDSDHDLMFP